jgi:very-short-patch-repair endonuclease
LSAPTGTIVRVQIDGFLRQQAGVIGRDQALRAGLTTRQIDRRVAERRWLPMYPRVYLAADRELTVTARVYGATLCVGEQITVSGLAAAWWHSLWPEPPSTVELTVPESRCPRARAGIRIRRRDIDPADRVGIRGIWMTSVPLTVLEGAVALGDRGPELLDRALQRQVTFEDLHRAHCRNLGRRGAPAAGRLLAAAADRAASVAERRLISSLRGARIAGWQLHYRMGAYELGFAFADRRVAIEVDGWAWHHDPRSFRNDRKRQNSLILAGWTVLRFTWHALTQTPDQAVAEVRAALAGRAAS